MKRWSYGVVGLALVVGVSAYVQLRGYIPELHGGASPVGRLLTLVACMVVVGYWAMRELTLLTGVKWLSPLVGIGVVVALALMPMHLVQQQLQAKRDHIQRWPVEVNALIVDARSWLPPRPKLGEVDPVRDARWRVAYRFEAQGKVWDGHFSVPDSEEQRRLYIQGKAVPIRYAVDAPQLNERIHDPHP